MDSYIQILCRFQKCKRKVPPPSPLINNFEKNCFIAKKLILSNIHIDVSNIKQIHISTNNETLIVNLDKNDIQTSDMSKYELGKIDALLNVASIITSIMNN